MEDGGDPGGTTMRGTRLVRSALRHVGMLGVGLALSACGGDAVSDGGGTLVGKAPPPSLGSYGAEWFGPLAVGLDAGKGLDWKALHGNVVYVEFGFLR